MKSALGATALTLAALIRMTDFVSDIIVATWFWKQYKDYQAEGNSYEQNWSLVKFIYTLTSLTAWAFVAAFISAIRQFEVEKRHPAPVAFACGFTQIQYLVEVYDSVMSGHKTGTLKLLHLWGTIVNTIPNTVFQIYQGFAYTFSWQIVFSTTVGLLSMSLTLVSVEKEMYRKKKFGKLPLFSSYSIILFVYRIIEVPARFYSITLFTAEFGSWILLGLAIDMFVLALIRASGSKRLLSKQRRVQAALHSSVRALGKSVDELKVMGLLDDDTFEDERIGIVELGIRFCVWLFVFLDGIDPIPYTLLRLFEGAALACLFFLFVDDIDDYSGAMLLTTAIVLFTYSFVAVLWQHYRSYASFLNPEDVTNNFDVEMVAKKIDEIERQNRPSVSTKDQVDEDFESEEDSEFEEHRVAHIATVPLKQTEVAAAAAAPEEKTEATLKAEAVMNTAKIISPPSFGEIETQTGDIDLEVGREVSTQKKAAQEKQMCTMAVQTDEDEMQSMLPAASLTRQEIRNKLRTRMPPKEQYRACSTDQSCLTQ